MNTVSQFLRATVEVINTYGWTQFSMKDSNGNRCVIGAMWSLLNICTIDLYVDSLKSLNSCIGGFPSDYTAILEREIVDWNDSWERTEEDVMQTLLTCADNNETKE